MRPPTGISALSLSFPSVIRNNDYYKEKYPDLFARSEQKSLAKLFTPAKKSASTSEYDLEMMPYLKDPFRGAVQRRILGPNESSITLECQAAKNALKAANLSVNEIDLLIVCSVLPEHIGYGNAAFVARELGLKCGAWNLDATCGSTPVVLQTATALVQAGEYKNVLVVVSCTYSRTVDESDTLAWFFSDGAGAFVISALEINQGIISTHVINTAVLCDQFKFKTTNDEEGNTRLHLHIARNTNKIMSSSATGLLRTCCEGAIEKAGVTLNDIDFFIFNTPTAWFSSFCIRVLGINPERTINVYPLYSNIGPALTIANLYHAAHQGKIRENDLVLMYGFGAAGSAAASVMRWGNVALGSFPI